MLPEKYQPNRSSVLEKKSFKCISIHGQNDHHGHFNYNWYDYHFNAKNEN